jgi:DNA-binding GntR family transcriptional regulator
MGRAPRSSRAASTSVERTYEHLRALAVTFAIKPNERINEVELSRRLGVSRTPLREALNRLAIEGYVTTVKSKGFFGRQLNAKDVFDLYELRVAVETESVRLAGERATDGELKELRHFVMASRDEREDEQALKLLRLDEQFHERIAELSRNAEIVRAIRRLNGRIHFVRWIDMQHGRRSQTQAEHLAIVDAMAARNAAKSVALMRSHITRRLDQIVEVIKVGFAQIYMGDHSKVGGTRMASR